jgi:ubiquinone/menaquinone biosynthesis C-methylase UbiE
MKREFDIHRDIWGPQVTFLLQILTESQNTFQDKVNSISVDFSLTHGKLPMLKKTQTNWQVQEGIIFRNLADESQTLKYFDYAANEFDLATKPYKDKFYSKIFSLLQYFLPENALILDPSCGTGLEAIALSKLSSKGKVICVDLSNKMIQLAFRNAKLQGVSNIEFYHANHNQLPDLWNQQFDSIFSSLSFQYYPDPEKSAASFSKLIHRNGNIIVVDPLRTDKTKIIEESIKLANPHFQRFYTLNELCKYFEIYNLKLAYHEEIFKGIGFSIFNFD